MTHAVTLALIYALSLEAVHLLHAAAAGWAAERRLALEPLPLLAAAMALVIGIVLATDRVTTGVALDDLWTSVGWSLAGLTLLLALWLHECRASGRRWRAMAANAPGLIAAGLPIGVWPPAMLGLAIAAIAGWLAPPPTASDWLLFAALAFLVSGAAARPRGWAVRSVLLAWLTGALIGAAETLIDPRFHLLGMALAGLVAAHIAATHLQRRAAS